MKILNFGSCNIDFVYSLDHIVTPGETQHSYKMETFPGGKGLNQSIAIARGGANVYHAGCVGNDAQMLLDIMNESGVDTGYIKTVDCKNGHAIIQVNAQGENSIFLHSGSNAMITKEYVDEVLDNFKKDDIILLQNEISNLEYIIDKSYEKGMCIVLNPSPYDEIIERIDLGKISYIVLNEIEATQITGFENIEEILNSFKKLYPDLKVMLTLGKNGCVYLDKENRIFQPVFEVNPVDTTAAGDTFTGYFIASLSKGEKYSDILKIASCASAIAVSRNGAAPSIPNMEEVKNSLVHLNENITQKSGTLQNKIIKYIDENIRIATLDELARHIGYSRSYTADLVKKMFGKPFTKLLQDKRCKLAVKLLSDGEKSVNEIIECVGYENRTFFRTVFKNKYGKNLLEYKKDHIRK
ncbi:MAG: helix-turn-helix domain-containing protein [Clostridia bacterium]|nr:helix-turn-helix domain-containing protein [Clostridia bacterium]